MKNKPLSDDIDINKNDYKDKPAIDRKLIINPLFFLVFIVYFLSR